MKTSLPKSSYNPQTLPQRIRQQYAMVRSEFCGQQEQIWVNPETGDYRTNKQYNNPQIGNPLHPLSETQNQNTSKREPISIWETRKTRLQNLLQSRLLLLRFLPTENVRENHHHPQKRHKLYLYFQNNTKAKQKLHRMKENQSPERFLLNGSESRRIERKSCRETNTPSTELLWTRPSPAHLHYCRALW